MKNEPGKFKSCADDKRWMTSTASEQRLFLKTSCASMSPHIMCESVSQLVKTNAVRNLSLCRDWTNCASNPQTQLTKGGNHRDTLTPTIAALVAGSHGRGS